MQEWCNSLHGRLEISLFYNERWAYGALGVYQKSAEEDIRTREGGYNFSCELISLGVEMH
jgi:hypothetical protein